MLVDSLTLSWVGLNSCMMGMCYSQSQTNVKRQRWQQTGMIVDGGGEFLKMEGGRQTITYAGYCSENVKSRC